MQRKIPSLALSSILNGYKVIYYKEINQIKIKSTVFVLDIIALGTEWLTV